MIKSIKIRLKWMVPVFLMLLVSNSCSSDDEGVASKGEDLRLQGRDMVAVFHNNPRTGEPYTQEELNDLGYNPAEEEVYNQCDIITLNIWAQQKPEKVEIINKEDGVMVTVINSFQRKDRPEFADYKDGYGYQAEWITTTSELGITSGSSISYDIKVTYHDVGIDGFLTPSERATSFKINYEDNGQACIDLDKDLVGIWKFDDPANLTKAEKGTDLLLNGLNVQEAQPGITTGDGAALIGLGSWYEMNPGLAASSGGDLVNDYTMIMDVNVPATSGGKYINLVQNHTANDRDGFLYISPSLGFWINGGTSSFSGTIKVDTWHRIVISVEAPNLRIYVDGQKVSESTWAPVDGSGALNPSKVLLFADDNGEDSPIKVSQIMLFNKGFIGPHIAKFPSVGEQF